MVKFSPVRSQVLRPRRAEAIRDIVNGAPLAG
jgi:hypothetical protein